MLILNSTGLASLLRSRDRRRPRDAGCLEHVNLGRVAEEDGRAELRFEHLEPVPTLLDQRHLVAHAGERTGDVRSDLAPARDDCVHQPVLPTGVGS